MVVMISPHMFEHYRFVRQTVSSLNAARLAYTTLGEQVHKILKKRKALLVFFLF